MGWFPAVGILIGLITALADDIMAPHLVPPVHAMLGAYGKGEKLFNPDSRWLVTLVPPVENKPAQKRARLWDLKAVKK